MSAKGVPLFRDLKVRGDAAMVASKAIMEDLHENLSITAHIQSNIEFKTDSHGLSGVSRKAPSDSTVRRTVQSGQLAS
jgi:ABC-type uncharacterized transport system permease subunit